MTKTSIFKTYFSHIRKKIKCFTKRKKWLVDINKTNIQTFYFFQIYNTF